jgi:hypothetical protein
VTAVVVAVPARDEAALVSACIRSIDLAAGACAGVRTVIVVAADRCRDSTAAVARRTPVARSELVILEGRWRSASAVRAAAAREGLARCGADPAATWLANTDADCTVPAGWLADQLRHANRGADAVAGTVTLDATAPERLAATFAARYRLGVDAHGHVHAANFGVRAEAYGAVGGWLTRTVVGEEHDLMRRLVRRGWRVVQPLDPPVATSPRLHGRVVGGFAALLSRL